jgi:hypothetical protein
MSRVSVPLTGFSLETARVLSQVAEERRLASKKGASVKYPQPLSQGGAGYFAVTNGTLSHGGSVTVEKLSRIAGDPPPTPAWERSGVTETAYDIFFNVGETIAACYLVYVVSFEGLPTIASIYCKINDWLEGCPS